MNETRIERNEANLLVLGPGRAGYLRCLILCAIGTALAMSAFLHWRSHAGGDFNVVILAALVCLSVYCVGFGVLVEMSRKRITVDVEKETIEFAGRPLADRYSLRFDDIDRIQLAREKRSTKLKGLSLPVNYVYWVCRVVKKNGSSVIIDDARHPDYITLIAELLAAKTSLPCKGVKSALDS